MDWPTRSQWSRRFAFPGDRLLADYGIKAENAPASAQRGYFVPTAAQYDLVSFLPPGFGEYADLAEYLQTMLRLTGYGEFR